MKNAQVDKLISLKNILFLTDFSEPSGVALPIATAIARTYGSTVHALHVILPSAYTYMTPEAATTLLDDQEDMAKAEMQRVDAALTGVPRETIIERGSGVWPVLSEILKEGQTDLIVLGTHGRTGMQKVLLGSSAEEIFRRSPVPVLTIGPTVRSGAHNGGRFRCVLFATDFQQCSLTAVRYALSFAQENQAQLVLLHVLPKHRYRRAYQAERTISCRSVASTARVDSGRSGSVVQAGGGRRAARRPGRPDNWTAAERKADLIVLGARGIDGMAAMSSHVARATAYKVVVKAPCPVLTVRS